MIYQIAKEYESEKVNGKLTIWEKILLIVIGISGAGIGIGGVINSLKVALASLIAIVASLIVISIISRYVAKKNKKENKERNVENLERLKDVLKRNEIKSRRGVEILIESYMSYIDECNASSKKKQGTAFATASILTSFVCTILSKFESVNSFTFIHFFAIFVAVILVLEIAIYYVLENDTTKNLYKRIIGELRLVLARNMIED